jgi:hypothetical protein
LTVAKNWFQISCQKYTYQYFRFSGNKEITNSNYILRKSKNYNVKITSLIISSNKNIPTTMTAETTAMTTTEEKRTTKVKTPSTTTIKTATQNTTKPTATAVRKNDDINDNIFVLHNHAGEATTHDGMVKKLRRVKKLKMMINIKLMITSVSFYLKENSYKNQ